MSRAAHRGRAVLLALALLWALPLAGCGETEVPAAPASVPAPSAAPFVPDSVPQSQPAQEDETDDRTGESAARSAAREEENMVYIRVGEHTLTAALEDNPSAAALAALLEEGPVTIQVENYGGFEKVGALPEALPRSDTRLTARPGDVMLYQGDNIVLFYGSNSWAYTKLARIADTDGLEAALSGSETELTLSLEP